MRRGRLGTVLSAVALCAAAGTAGAMYTLSAGYPWSYSETGTETASAIAVDFQGFLVIAGNITRPGPGSNRDVLLQVYSLTRTGQPIGSTEFDSGYGFDEGPPALKLRRRANWPYLPEVFAAFTAPTPTAPAYGLINMHDYFLETATLFQDAGGFPVTAAPALDLSPSGTPYLAGWITAGGVDQLVTMRIPRTPGSGKPDFDRVHVITATFWSGSATMSVTGRAIAVEGSGAFRIAAQSGGDVWIFRYTTDTYPDPTPQQQRAIPAPGFPRALVTPSRDEPEVAALDGLGYLWVAGSIDNDGAIWRFDAQGNLAPGFPVRFNAGASSRFAAIAITADRHALVTGSAGGNMLLAGVDETGATLTGLPLTSAAPAGSSGAGHGIAAEADGSAWIAGTWSRTGGETSIMLWHYAFTPDPPPVAPGEVVVRGSEGEILNLARGETVAILALPRAAGDVRVQVLTPRGELVRAFMLPGRGNELARFTWDGRNAAGEPVASGLYAIRVTGGGLAAVRRVVVYRKR